MTWAAASGGGITALTGDVTASGTGSVAATVALVGGTSAASVASTVGTVAAASSSATINTLALRDGSGDISFANVNAVGGFFSQAPSVFTNGLMVNSGLLSTAQFTPPGTVLEANSGAGATLTFVTNDTDIAGTLTLTLGTGAASGAQGRLDFTFARSIAPAVFLMPANALAATNAVEVFATSTTTGFTINFNNAGTDSQAYVYHYFVMSPVAAP